jgi:hypothetical protein
MYPANPPAIVFCILSVVTLAAIGRAAENKEPEKVLRHAVFFKFKDATSDEDLAKIVAAFDALPKKIDSIKDYQRGKNISPFGLDDGLTHCFLITFADEAGRTKYLPHPEHNAFVDVLKPHLDKVFVIDYWGTPEKSRKDRELKHVLFVKFRADATDDEVKGVEEAIAKLPSQCDSIKAFEWGKNNSPETHDEGFTHCFMFTFDDTDGLRKYFSIPEHRQVVEKVQAAAEKGRVMDFWTKDEAADK